MTMEPTVEQEQTTTFYWLLDMTDVWYVLEKNFEDEKRWLKLFSKQGTEGYRLW